MGYFTKALTRMTFSDTLEKIMLTYRADKSPLEKLAPYLVLLRFRPVVNKECHFLTVPGLPWDLEKKGFTQFTQESAVTFKFLAGLKDHNKV